MGFVLSKWSLQAENCPRNGLSVKPTLEASFRPFSCLAPSPPLCKPWDYDVFSSYAQLFPFSSLRGGPALAEALHVGNEARSGRNKEVRGISPAHNILWAPRTGSPQHNVASRQSTVLVREV